MKVFFISETHRADAQTWLRGLKEFGNCEIETWEIIPRPGPFSRLWRMKDWLFACLFLGKRIRNSGADILLSERVTSYGFIGACTGFHPFVVAQQGVTDVWPPNSVSTPFKAFLARYALKKADLIQSWGTVMVPAMLEHGADPAKIKVLAKGIDLDLFSFDMADKQWDKIRGIVTRSLTPDYHHDVIIKAARILKDRNIPAEIKIIGDGRLMAELKQLAIDLDVNDIIAWVGRIPNTALPSYLNAANMYISVPITEGVSASLFEAMGSGAFPVVTDLPGTAAWIKPGQNGCLVPINDATALAESMIKAWNDKSLMRQAILSNRKFAEEHADFKKNLPVFIGWYKKLIFDT
jgi:glycosyltransferase involved in cell wall biosynthesis